MSKRQFYWEWVKRAFVRPLLVADLGAGVWAVIGGAISYFSPGLATPMDILLWAIPLSLFCIIVVFGFLCAPLSIYKELERQKVSAEKELQAFKNTSPSMRFQSTENVAAPIRNFTGKVYGTPYFTHALFANDPPISELSAVALKTVGHIEFWNVFRTEKFFEMVGRWADTREFGLAGVSIIEENQIDIAPNAVPRKLDIALKYLEDEDCYAYNNDVAMNAPKDWRYPPFKLSPGNYHIKVRLRGANVDQEFWFKLVNGGKGKQLELRFLS